MLPYNKTLCFCPWCQVVIVHGPQKCRASHIIHLPVQTKFGNDWFTAFHALRILTCQPKGMMFGQGRRRLTWGMDSLELVCGNVEVRDLAHLNNLMSNDVAYTKKGVLSSGLFHPDPT